MQYAELGEWTRETAQSENAMPWGIPIRFRIKEASHFVDTAMPTIPRIGEMVQMVVRGEGSLFRVRDVAYRIGTGDGVLIDLDFVSVPCDSPA